MHVCRGTHDLQPASAAARACFDRHRIADALRNSQSLLRRFDGSTLSRDDRYADAFRALPRRDLAAHRLHRLGGWTDKDKSRFSAGQRKFGYFPRESHTRGVWPGRRFGAPPRVRFRYCR